MIVGVFALVDVWCCVLFRGCLMAVGLMFVRLTGGRVGVVAMFDCLRLFCWLVAGGFGFSGFGFA